MNSSQLQAYCNTLKSDKKIFEKRVKELRSIQNSIYDSVSGHPTKVTGSTNDTRLSVRIGLGGISSLSALDSSLSRFEQKRVDADSDISNVLNNIANEITRCNNKMSSLDTEIATTNNAIRAAKAAEARAREEAEARARAEAEARAKAAAEAKAALNS